MVEASRDTLSGVASRHWTINYIVAPSPQSLDTFQNYFSRNTCSICYGRFLVQQAKQRKGPWLVQLRSFTSCPRGHKASGKDYNLTKIGCLGGGAVGFYSRLDRFSHGWFLIRDTFMVEYYMMQPFGILVN